MIATPEAALTTPAPIYGPEHLDEFGDWVLRVAVYPAGCPRPDGVEIEEMTTPGWAMTVERVRVNRENKGWSWNNAPGDGYDPEDTLVESPVYRLPSDRRCPTGAADAFADFKLDWTGESSGQATSKPGALD